MLRRYQNLVIVLLFASLIFAVAGCETMGEDTKRGAVGGGLVGSIAGGVIGHQMGRGIEGAAIGAGVGAVTGGLIGSSIDKQKDQILTSGEKLGISDIIVLSKAGVSDDTIISKISRTGSVFSLSVEEIEALRNDGVSSRVVNYMLTRQ